MPEIVGQHRLPILVVADDPLVRRLLVDLLELKGYPVLTAPNGDEALAQLAQQRVGLFVLDVQMPLRAAVTFACQVMTQVRNVPIVALTGSPEARWLAEEICAAGFLGKPFHPHALWSLVANVYAHQPGATAPP